MFSNYGVCAQRKLECFTVSGLGKAAAGSDLDSVLRQLSVIQLGRKETKEVPH